MSDDLDAATVAADLDDGRKRWIQKMAAAPEPICIDRCWKKLVDLGIAEHVPTGKRRQWNRFRLTLFGREVADVLGPPPPKRTPTWRLRRRARRAAERAATAAAELAEREQSHA